MKGLLIKDFKLMKGQKYFFILIFIVALGMSLFSDDVTFALGFLTFVVSLFTLSTISYDEFDNGNAFLFTLPFTRNQYVMEKYIFGILIGISSWVLSMSIALIINVFKDILPILDIIMTAFMIIPIMLVIQAIMIPFQLKFGGERGRLAIIGALGLVFVLGVVIIKMAEAMHVNLISMFNSLTVMGLGTMIAILIISSLILWGISMMVSISIMKKKEF